MELGIIGLPTSGKTTIFNALTHGDRPTAVASSGRLELFSLVVDVPDPRVDALQAMFKPRKTTYAKVSYTDIAGLDKDLGKKGLSGQLRNQIAPMDAFVHVIRTFEDPNIPHPLGSINPQRDLDTLDGEFLLADMIAVENRLERIAEGLHKGARGEERKALQENQELFERLYEALNDGMPLRDLGLSEAERANLRGYTFLTLKPILVLLNSGEQSENVTTMVSYAHKDSLIMSLCGKLEMEISQLGEDETELFMAEFGIQELALSRVIQASYKLVGLQSFFTIGEDEIRAWELPVDGTALDAAGTIHSDLARGFIRAEVIAFDDLIEAGSMTAARKAGTIHLEGKEYLVQDGDIVQVRFSI